MDEQGDGVILGPKGPRQVTTQGFISGPEFNPQGGLGLPSFNVQRDLVEVSDITVDDKRIIAALGWNKDSDQDSDSGDN